MRRSSARAYPSKTLILRSVLTRRRVYLRPPRLIVVRANDRSHIPQSRSESLPKGSSYSRAAFTVFESNGTHRACHCIVHLLIRTYFRGIQFVRYHRTLPSLLHEQRASFRFRRMYTSVQLLSLHDEETAISGTCTGLALCAFSDRFRRIEHD